MNFTILLPTRILFNTNASRTVFTEKICKRRFCSELLRCSTRSKKIVISSDIAISDIKDGATLLVGGYGLCGIPEKIIASLVKKGVKDLTVVTNDCTVDNFGVGLLLKEKRIKRIIASFVGQTTDLERKFLAGEIELEITPQGTLAERIRAGGAGIPAFFTPTAARTIIQEGGAPVKYAPDGNVEISSHPRSLQQFNGIDYVLEEAITADFALIKAWKSDMYGNLIFRKTARNINPVMCRAAKNTIVEVEEIVNEPIDPDNVHVPGIYVDKIFLGEKYERRIEKLKTSRKCSADSALSTTPAAALRDRIIRRAALELKDGMYVNFGIGLPTLLLNYLPSTNVIIHSEVGALGLGGYPTKSEIDADLINADKQTVTELPGGSFFGMDESFGMIRGGHIDLAVISAMEVSQYGDIASWLVPSKVVKGIGAAMDIVNAPNTRIIVVMEHNLKDGSPKIVEQCNLPLTGMKCISMIITEKAVFTVHPEVGLTLIEIADSIEVPEILMSTGCNFQVSPDLKPMGQIRLPSEENEQLVDIKKTDFIK
ncbi:succinyl-CoA:3-ketoacid CoA transferase [Lycorma delicatula]|uniref:succinyl-CoA:3-ketoacid CoA transferase n=1 Tax=Lycorma delicatula TaxID=130591 RepID=UPI003F5156A5